MLFTELLSQFGYYAQVPECFHSTYYLSTFVTEQGSADADRYASLVRPDNVNGHAFYGFSCFHGLLEHTSRLADVGSEHFEARPSNGILSGDSGNYLRPPIERHDIPVKVHGEDSVGNAV